MKQWRLYKIVTDRLGNYLDMEALFVTPDYGSPYKFNMSTYYSCEDGVYYEEHYDEIDGGLGVKEIGSVLLVNNDLLPSEMKEDGELVEKALEDWVNSHLTNPKVNPATVKPNWLI